MLLLKDEHKQMMRKNRTKLIFSVVFWFVPMIIMILIIPNQTNNIVFASLVAAFSSMMIRFYIDLKDVEKIHADYLEQLKDMEFSKLSELIILRQEKPYLVQHLLAQLVFESSFLDSKRIKTNNENLVRKVPTLRILDIKTFDGEFTKNEKSIIRSNLAQLILEFSSKHPPQKTLRQTIEV